MGENSGLPNAAGVLREAYELVRRPDVTGLGIDRASVLLGIARELREGARRVPPVVIGDNVPDEIVSVLEGVGAERDKWRRDAEAAQREIAELLRQGNGWMRRALRAELGVSYGATLDGEPAYREGGPVSAPVSAPLFDASRERFREWPNDVVVDPTLAQNVAVVGDPAERAYMDDVKVAVPQPERPADIRFGDAPTGLLPVLNDRTCPDCEGATYEAVTADGKETRHRETGTPVCPVR